MTTARGSEQPTNGHALAPPTARWSPFDTPPEQHRPGGTGEPRSTTDAALGAVAGTATSDDALSAPTPSTSTPAAPSTRPGPGSGPGPEPGAGSTPGRASADEDEAQETQHVVPEPRTGSAPAADANWGPDGDTPAPAAGYGRPLDADLSSARLLRPGKDVPRSGWRAAVYSLTGGLINPGASEADRARAMLIERVNQRLAGCYRVAAVSVKGGVGKTSTTALLGSAFASLRGDRVIALDANPDRGNLAEKVPQETTATVRHLLADAARIRTVSDIRAYTSQSKARLEVLASESDPATSEAFSAADYQAAIDLLSTHYNIILTDCGTGLLHSALQAAVEVADSLLIITSSSIDGARSAKATMEWLEAHGHRELVERSVTVITGVGARNDAVDLDSVERFFASHTRAVVRLPFDPHLADGAEIDLESLHPRTRDSVLELGALVADDFIRPGRRDHARRRTPALLPGHTDSSVRR